MRFHPICLLSRYAPCAIAVVTSAEYPLPNQRMLSGGSHSMCQLCYPSHAAHNLLSLPSPGRVLAPGRVHHNENTPAFRALSKPSMRGSHHSSF
jgi:hypothetical protein